MNLSRVSNPVQLSVGSYLSRGSNYLNSCLSSFKKYYNLQIWPNKTINLLKISPEIFWILKAWNQFIFFNFLYIDQVECPAIGKTFLFMQSNSLSIGSKTVLFLFPSFMDLTLHSHRISNLKMWDICRSFKIRKEETTWFYLARCSGKRIKKVSLNPGT